jgi:lysophospholipase L1-like esterase
MKRFILILAFGSVFAHAAAPKHAGSQQTTWTGSWAASPMAMPAPKAAVNPADTTDTSGATYRNIVHLSLGGSSLRLRISNEFGNMSLTLGGVHVALSAGKGGAIQPTTDHAVTFGGSETVMIPAGAMIVSDPIAMPVDAFADLTVSLFVPSQPGAALTYHALGDSTNYIAEGNATSAATLDNAKKVTSWYLLKGVDVTTTADASAVITLGDSITDGAHATLDANARWPNVLATRLHANPATANVAVLDEGISGNRLLHDVAGPSALARLDRDVLAQSGVKYVIVLLGINDIGHTAHSRGPDDLVTAGQLTWALQQIAIRAHAHGLKVYAATLTPYGGAGYQDANGLILREAENNFIRTSGVFDGVIDFDKVTRDPAHPDAFLPAYDSGDHLHPGDAGYKAMGDSIDLKLFQ